MIFYVDNHSSHFTLELCNFCIEKQIILLGLYPNSTHILQPLDVSLFHVLKDEYKKCNDSWRLENGMIDIKKADFAPILQKALKKDYSSCIINGFRTCGLFPFDPSAVNFNFLNKKSKRQKNVEGCIDVNIQYNTSQEDNQKLLDVFEKNILSPSIVEEFRNHDLGSLWSGDIEKNALYEAWKKLKILCGKIFCILIEINFLFF